MMDKHYMTVKQASIKFTAFSEAAIRMLIFKRGDELKAAGVVKKIGRRILIEEQAFSNWIDAQY